MSAYHYFAYGLHIHSDIRCSSLPKYNPDLTVQEDIVIRLGSTPDSLENPISQGVLFSANLGEYLLLIPNVATYFVRNANEIIVEPEGTYDENEVALFLLASPLAALLQQRGRFVLQASIVTTDKGAVAFTGTSGVGKSTIAMALARHGFPLLADKVCVIDIDSNNTPYVWPGAIDSFLWKDSLEMLGYDSIHLVKIRQGIEKYVFRMASNIKHQTPVILRKIYVLSVTNESTTSVDKVVGSLKVKTLFQQQFNERLVSDLPLKYSKFVFASMLAANTDMRNVRHPRTRKSLAATADEILLDLNSVEDHYPQLAVTQSQPKIDADTHNLCAASSGSTIPQKESPKRILKVSNKKKNLVWMASYPKSGNTWLRAFLANYTHDYGRPIDINELATDTSTGMLASQRKRFDELTGVEASSFTDAEINSLRPSVYRRISEQHAQLSDDPLFIKIHDIPTLSKANKLDLIPRNCTRAIIYVVRNPLDVAVSFAHHFELSIDESIRALNDDNHRIGNSTHGLSTQLQQVLTSWSGHYKSWVENQKNPVLVIRFEDMHENPYDTFRKVLEFSGIDVDSHRLERAVQNSSFDILKNQESEASFEENPAKGKFFRIGASGGWNQTLSRIQVDLVISKHSQVMQKLGYL